MFHLTSSVAYLVVNQFNCTKLNYAIHAMLKALQFKPRAHGTIAHELCHDLKIIFNKWVIKSSKFSIFRQAHKSNYNSLPSMTTWGELGKSNKWTSSRLIKHTFPYHNHMPWLVFNSKWPHEHCYNALQQFEIP